MHDNSSLNSPNVLYPRSLVFFRCILVIVKYRPVHKGVCLLLAQHPPLPPVGQGLLIHEVYRSYITPHHSRYDCSGQMISSSQRPLPDNTQYSQQTDRHTCPPVAFEPTIPASERPQTYALDRAATGTGIKVMN